MEFGKTILGWLHAVLIFVIALPAIASMGVQDAFIIRQLYLAAFLKVVPIVVSDIAAGKCRSFVFYLFFSVLSAAVSGYIGYVVTEDITSEMNMGILYLVFFVISAVIIITKRLFCRMDKARFLKEQENHEAGSPLAHRFLEVPYYPFLGWFFLCYLIGIVCRSPVLCNCALLHAILYFVITTVYLYLDLTKDYIESNERVKGIPVKRIYGICGSQVIRFLFVVTFMAIVAVICVPFRTYYTPVEKTKKLVELPPMENTEYEKITTEWQGEFADFQERKDPPAWLEPLFWLISTLILLMILWIGMRMFIRFMADFRQSYDENGDYVENVKEEDITQIEQLFPQRRKYEKQENSKIRRKYKKFILKNRKDRPKPYETPQEIENLAGVADTLEGKQMHEQYEKARYRQEKP